MLKRLSLVLIYSLISLTAFNQTHDLQFYLNEGIKNSPLLNDYKNQFYSATSDSLLIKAVKRPVVESKSQLLYSPYYHNFGYDEVITDGGNYTSVVSVSQNILNGKELANKYRGIEIQKQLLTNTTKLSRLELNKVITDQYLTAYSVYSNLLFNKSFLDLILNENDIVKEFVKKGVYKQTDYLTLLVESQSQEITIRQLESQFRKELSALNQLCGLIDSSRYELIKPDLLIRGSNDISKSPAFLKFKNDSLRIETEKTSIDLRYRPKINWFADAGFLTSNPWNFYRHFGYSAGISMNIPIYDGKQKGIEKGKLEFEQDTRLNYQTNFVKQYSMQILQLTHELKLLNQISDQTQTQFNTSGQLINALKNQLESGYIQMTEYINAIKNHRTISSNLTQITIQKLQLINEINFLYTQ